MADRIFFRDMVFHARHGVFPEEEKLGQRFHVDIDGHIDFRPWSRTDEFAKAVSYQDIYETVRVVVEGPRVNMIETLAERIAQAVLAAFPPVEAVRVEVRKPAAAIAGVFETVGVEITRTRRDLDPA